MLHVLLTCALFLPFQDDLTRRIDQYATAFTAAHDWSGTVLLAKDGKPIFFKAYGLADREWGIPNATDTKFSIGSVTKSFTAVLVMQLREQGRLKVDDSICMYITRCPDAWRPVTLHHLLTHTSGIPPYTALGPWARNSRVPLTPDEIVDFFRDLPLQFKPGERFVYNNSGFFLLGMAIEKVTGKTYEAVVRDQIFTPLGMNDSGYFWPGPIIAKRAEGYSGRGDGVQNARAIDMSHPFSAGALYSSASDLLKFDQALYGERLLPEAAKQLMWTPVMQNYGYGWDVELPSAATPGQLRIGHTGGGYGYGAVLMRVPGQKLTVIVLANTDSAPETEMTNAILAIHDGRPYTTPPPPLQVDTALLDKYAGRYEFSASVEIVFTREGRTLFYHPPGQRPIGLVAQSQTKFAVQGAPITFEFVAGPGGEITHVVTSRGGPARELKRIR